MTETATEILNSIFTDTWWMVKDKTTRDWGPVSSVSSTKHICKCGHTSLAHTDMFDVFDEGWFYVDKCSVAICECTGYAQDVTGNARPR